MKKKIGIGTVFLLLVILGLTGGVSAIPLSCTEYEILNVDPLGKPTYTVGEDLGYYIWTDDSARRNWHLRWTGDGDIYHFNGSVYLTALVDDTNLLSTSSFSFEGGSDYPDTFVTPYDGQSATYFAYASTGEDGLDFVIIGDAFGYIAFDLHIFRMSGDGPSPAPVASFVNIGSDSIHPGSEDFRIAAPVPEPATMMLLGTGLIGLAAIGRRKIFRSKR